MKITALFVLGLLVGGSGAFAQTQSPSEPSPAVTLTIDKLQKLHDLWVAQDAAALAHTRVVAAQAEEQAAQDHMQVMQQRAQPILMEMQRQLMRPVAKPSAPPHPVPSHPAHQPVTKHVAPPHPQPKPLPEK